MLDDIINYIQPYTTLLNLLLLVIILYVLFFIFLKLLRRHLLKKVKTKKQISNITVFLSLLKFLFVFFLVIIAVAFYYGNLGDLSFIAGLLTVALGFALQKPISSVVAWFILITRRPFNIGDRVIISDIKGDVADITLTHIFLNEVGGTIEGEELSGRTVMVPTSIIFEQGIINYTHLDEYILVEIVTAITYESNLELAEKIITSAVNNIMSPYWKSFPDRINKKPHIRLQFKESGIEVIIRYYTIATKRNEIATNIRREIFKKIKKTKDVEIAYPHTEVLFREKNPIK